MAIENRGGVPRVVRLSFTGDTHHRFPALIKHLRVRNTGAVAVRMFFREEDMLASPQAAYVELPVAAAGVDLFDGPVEATDIWFDVAAGTGAVEVVGYSRRG